MHAGSMPKPLSPFCHRLLDDLEPLGRVSGRGMFGSTGLFMDGLMFGLVSSDDGLYIKADDRTHQVFETAGCPPFTYHGRRGEIALSYFRLTDADTEDENALLRFARLGLEAARRQDDRKRGTGRSTPDPWRSLIL